jgi:hypothetical protein
MATDPLDENADEPDDKSIEPLIPTEEPLIKSTAPGLPSEDHEGPARIEIKPPFPPASE